MALCVSCKTRVTEAWLLLT